MTSFISSVRRFTERARRRIRMNRFERQPQAAVEAEVEYRDGDFRIRRPGAFVRCAVTGEPIPLEELRYWNVDLQEAYSSTDAKLARIGVSFPKKS
jgi:hypothetical protein